MLDVLHWDEEARRHHFRGSSMKRAKLNMIRRNAVIVAGNILAEIDNPELLTKLKEIASSHSEDPLVSSAAQVVLKKEELKG